MAVTQLELDRQEIAQAVGDAEDDHRRRGRRDLRGESDVVVGMRVAGSGRLALRLELLGGKGPDRLEQIEAAENELPPTLIRPPTWARP